MTAASAPTPDDRPVTVDADSHLQEPVTWLAHVDADLARRCGGQALLAGTAAFAGLDPTRLPRTAFWTAIRAWADASTLADAHRLADDPATAPYFAVTAFDPIARVAWLDRVGIDHQICNPTLAAHMALGAATISDELGREVMEAFNRWTLDATADADGRLHPTALVDLTDLARSAEELARMAAAGSATFLVPIDADLWDHLVGDDAAAFWAVAADLDVMPELHLGVASGRGASPSSAGPASVWADRQLGAQRCVLRWVSSAHASNHPSIRLLVQELGIDWAGPWLRNLEQAERTGVVRALGGDPGSARAPSEIARSQVVWVPLPRDPIEELVTRHPDISLAFGSDHPHSEGWGDDPTAAVTRRLGDSTVRTRLLHELSDHPRFRRTDQPVDQVPRYRHAERGQGATDEPEARTGGRRSHERPAAASSSAGPQLPTPSTTAERTTPTAPSLMLGCMLFGRWGITDARVVERIVEEALELGIDGFDTAAAYGDGDSEVLLGRALRRRPERGLICTKVGAPTGTGEAVDEPRRFHSAIDGSLRRLGVDHIDVMLIHRVDDGTPMEALLEALGDAQAAGKIGAIGASCMTGDLLLELVLTARSMGLSIEHEQCKYSLLDRSSESSFFPVARRHGVRTMLYGILDEGILGGIEGRPPNTRGGRPRRGAEVHPWPDAARRSVEQRRLAARRLEALAAESGLTLLELALGFACDPTGPAGVATRSIVGVSGPGQIEPLVAAAATQLDPPLRAAIDQIVVPGSAVGIPDRSRIRRAVMPPDVDERTPLLVGGPGSAPRSGAPDPVREVGAAIDEPPM